MSLSLPLQPGDPTRLGRYELLGRLGHGGMGVVFLGQDDAGFVAIKTINSAHVGDARAMRRFRREVEAAKRVPRYCTAQVYEHDFDYDPPFIVSEFIKGPNSRSRGQGHRPVVGLKVAWGGDRRGGRPNRDPPRRSGAWRSDPSQRPVVPLRPADDRLWDLPGSRADG